MHNQHGTPGNGRLESGNGRLSWSENGSDALYHVDYAKFYIYNVESQKRHYNGHSSRNVFDVSNSCVKLD